MTMILVIATTAAVFFILQTFGVFEIMLTSQKVVSEIRGNRKIATQRKHEKLILQIYSTVTNMFRGILMNDLQYEKHNYWIQRLEIRSDKLDRPYTPEELRGKYVAPILFSAVLIPLAFINILFLGPIVFFIVRFILYPVSYNTKIRDEDEIIDNYFIDLYLLLYSKLRQGSRARLQGTVENYIDTLQDTNTIEVKNVMLKLARYLLNLLSLYEDHVAVPKLKEIYHSATIINFCNVATQSLNGVENFDNLLTFKMQLVERKTELMRERSQAIV